MTDAIPYALTDARTLVVSYIRYRVCQRHLPYAADVQDSDTSVGDVQQALRLLGEELENKYAEVIIIKCLLVLK